MDKFDFMQKYEDRGTVVIAKPGRTSDDIRGTLIVGG
jgi:hypothetical protein